MSIFVGYNEQGQAVYHPAKVHRLQELVKNGWWHSLDKIGFYEVVKVGSTLSLKYIRDEIERRAEELNARVLWVESANEPLTLPKFEFWFQPEKDCI